MRCILLFLIGLVALDAQGFLFPPRPHFPVMSMVRERFLDRVAARRQGPSSNDPSGTCPSLRERLHSRTLLKPCCDGFIKKVVERGMATLDLFGSTGPKSLGPLLQALHKFVQNHFKVAFEIIMAPKDFHLKTNYNGTKMCKFESNNYFLAVYETPGHYDINSPRESFFSQFATNDKLRLPMIIQQRLRMRMGK